MVPTRNFSEVPSIKPISTVIILYIQQNIWERNQRSISPQLTSLTREIDELLLRVKDNSQAKVGDGTLAVAFHQDVLRFDVAMGNLRFSLCTIDFYKTFQNKGSSSFYLYEDVLYQRRRYVQAAKHQRLKQYFPENAGYR